MRMFCPGIRFKSLSLQVSTWFFKKRGAALGLVAAGSSLGGVILPIMVIQLIPKVGFGWAMRICAFLILSLLIFANLTVRSRIAPTKRPFDPMAFIRPLQEPPFLLLTGAVFFFYCKLIFIKKRQTQLILAGGMFIPFTFIVEEASRHGMSGRLANYLVPILNGARSAPSSSLPLHISINQSFTVFSAALFLTP